MAVLILLPQGQFHRKPGAGIFRALSAVVGDDALFQVRRPAAVQGAVSAPQEVNVIHRAHTDPSVPGGIPRPCLFPAYCTLPAGDLQARARISPMAVK